MGRNRSYNIEFKKQINKGIPNRAFYETAIQIGSEDARKLWVDALLRLLPKSDFADATVTTLEAAKSLFGDRSRQLKAVQKAWEMVGVLGNPQEQEG